MAGEEVKKATGDPSAFRFRLWNRSTLIIPASGYIAQLPPERFPGWTQVVVNLPPSFHVPLITALGT
jgi:hypothetical protein